LTRSQSESFYFKDAESRFIRTGEALIDVEERESWPDRPDAWALTTKMPLRDQAGSIFGTFSISRDITERKKAEERIQGLARFPDENPQPVIRVTPDGSVIYANKASEILTSSWAGETSEIHEATRTFAVTVVPLAAGGYVNLYGRDVTEEKILAQRLHQAQKLEAIGQLTGGVAHDFNVLHVILGFCEVLERDLPRESHRYVGEIVKAARRAATLNAQLLAFSRKQTLRPRVDTKELIRSTRAMLERVIGEDLELRTFIDPGTGNVLADPGKMEQVLLNLAVNARDAMPQGGKLTLETSRNQSTTCNSPADAY
jgi:two-component system cell cycle sensor histidine kinase/response regulator CckA